MNERDLTSTPLLDRLLRQYIREGLTEELMAVAREKVDEVVELAMADLETTIRAEIDGAEQRLLIDTVVVKGRIEAAPGRRS